MIASHYVYWVLFAVMLIGLYVVISHGNLLKKLIGLTLFQVGIFLFFISLGKVTGGSAPIISDGVETYSHPLPQVLILTAIVVGVATLAVGLALAVRIFESYGTVEEDEVLERDAADHAADRAADHAADHAADQAADRAADRAGALAAAEQGVALERLALIPHPGELWPTVVAALLDGVDLVVLQPPAPPTAAEGRRLAARVRQRSAVMLPTQVWERAETILHAGKQQWYGLEQGRGRLRARQLTVSASGRGRLTRPRQVRVWLPAPDGAAIAPVTAAPAVTLTLAPRAA